MKTQVLHHRRRPSGLMLSQLLHLKGHRHRRARTAKPRVRSESHSCGVLEHGFAKLMREAQCGERMDREGEIHEGFFIANNGTMKRMDLHKYSGGNSVVVYGQTELTRDLYEARDRMNGVVIHNAEDVQPHDLTKRHRTSPTAAATTSCASIATTSSAPTAFTASAASRSRRTCCVSMKRSIPLAGSACSRAPNRCRRS